MLSSLKKALEVDVAPPGNGVMRICDADVRPQHGLVSGPVVSQYEPP